MPMASAGLTRSASAARFDAASERVSAALAIRLTPYERAVFGAALRRLHTAMARPNGGTTVAERLSVVDGDEERARAIDWASNADAAAASALIYAASGHNVVDAAHRQAAHALATVMFPSFTDGAAAIKRLAFCLAWRGERDDQHDSADWSIEDRAAEALAVVLRIVVQALVAAPWAHMERAVRERADPAVVLAFDALRATPAAHLPQHSPDWLTLEARRFVGATGLPHRCHAKKCRRLALPVSKPDPDVSACPLAAHFIQAAAVVAMRDDDGNVCNAAPTSPVYPMSPVLLG